MVHRAQLDADAGSLSRELRWLVRVRWAAGVTLLLAVVANGLVTGWTGSHWTIAAVAVTVLLYNLVLQVLVRSPRAESMTVTTLWLVAGLQIAADLAALTAITLSTGGLSSPMLWLFALHMVLTSMLLPAIMSYIAAATAMAMVLGSLWALGRWPADDSELRLVLGWILLLLLAAYLTNHITINIRGQERLLRRQNQRIRAILDTAADGVISIGADGIIRSVNPAAERIFGYAANEMVGRNVRMLMPDPDSANHDQYLRRYLDTGEARIIGIGREVIGRRNDGTTFPLDLSVGEVRGEPDRRLFTGIVRDITDRKLAEQEVHELNDALRRQQMLLAQSEKMAAMGQMAAGVAHEIANPLASMDSLIQLVQRQPDRMSKRTGELLREQITRINDIVRQLTDFAHPDDIGWQSTSLNEVVSSALDMLRFDHRLRRVDVVRSMGEDVGDVVLNPRAIQQVVVNLVMNAVDALDGAAEPRLEVRTRRDDGWAAIEVTDNGDGIAPEHLGRIFEPFFTTKPVGRGTGLGLSITYSLVQRHDGRCEVRSDPGVGTSISILLPAAGPSDRPPPQ